MLVLFTYDYKKFAKMQRMFLISVLHTHTNHTNNKTSELFFNIRIKMVDTFKHEQLLNMKIYNAVNSVR